MAALLILDRWYFTRNVAICPSVCLSHGIVHWVAHIYASKVMLLLMYGAPHVYTLRSHMAHIYRTGRYHYAWSSAMHCNVNEINVCVIRSSDSSTSATSSYRTGDAHRKYIAARVRTSIDLPGAAH